NGVEQVRELRDTVRYAPARGKFKIYIIDEVHMLTTAAFNALLKTLEEPPEHVKFMFATTDPEKVLPTILSRCQRFDLRRIPVSLITDHLSLIARQEKVNIDAEALHAIARGADGGMRDAESALDQLISFCGEKIVESDVLSMFGLTARSQVMALTAALFQGEPATALGELNELARHGKDLGRFLSDLLNHCRNLLIFQVSKGDLKLLEVTEAEAASLKEQASMISTESLTRVMEVLTDAESRLRDAASKKIFVEVTLLKVIQARAAVSIDEVMQRLQELRADGGPSGSATAATPAPKPAPAARASGSSRSAQTAASAPSEERDEPMPQASDPEPALVAPAPVAGIEPSTDVLSELDLVILWQEVLEAVGRASPFTKNYLLEAHPVSVAKNVFTIGFDPEFADHIELVNNSKTCTLLQTKLSEAGRPQMQIRFIRAERPASFAAARTDPSSSDAPAPAAAPAPESTAPAAAAPGAAASSPARKPKPGPQALTTQDFKDDPLIQKALEIFKGRIIEVRA
ncbi:MAG TPA: DNA polymerase III subunit gamma/tau, partial [Candidatus Saccharimonadales bacterium]|nr:DNA polymerase III subunit gamma/tau [Candidatus Saccharimonadales bacterium]